MKQFAILFAAVCAMTFMGSQAEAQCGGGGYGGGYRSVGINSGFGGYGNNLGGVYRQPIYRPVYAGSFGSGFGGYGAPAYRGGGVSIGIGRGFGGYGGGFGGYGGGRGYRW